MRDIFFLGIATMMVKFDVEAQREPHVAVWPDSGTRAL